MCVKDRSLIKYKTSLNKKTTKLDSKQSLSKLIYCLLNSRYKFKVDKVTINSFTNKVILYVDVLDMSIKLRVSS